MLLSVTGRGACVCAYERTCNFYRTEIVLLFHLLERGQIFLPIHVDLPHLSQRLLGAPEMMVDHHLFSRAARLPALMDPPLAVPTVLAMKP